MKTAAQAAGGLAAASTSRLSDLSQLVKARLTFLVLVTTAAGFYLAHTPVDFAGLSNVLLGVGLAAAGASALNQWSERDFDALMLRTMSRPVPAGRMRPRNALVLGAALATAGVSYLTVSANLLTGALGAATVLIYIFGYTPLKRVTTTNTLVGAIPGALPPLIGWAAARNALDLGAWSLFAIVFLWQMPHFFAIAWICREDYSRAGFHMLSNGDDRGRRSASQAVLFTMSLLLVATAPAFAGVCNPWYLIAATILTGSFIAAAMHFHTRADRNSARLLFLSSIAYLPLLLAAMILTKL